MSEPLLRISGLSKSFKTRHGVVQAIDGVDLELAEGTTMSLVGESGSGKTTLGRCALALTDTDAGTVAFQGRDLTTLGGRELRRLRRDMQMVFQAQSASLNPRMTVGAVLEEPLKLAGVRERASRRERVLEALRQVQLDEAYVGRYPSELSGGEQQRVGIARAIITEPRLVVLDEPTAALDAEVRKGIYDLLGELQQRLGLTYLIISHDLSSVWGVSDTVAVMHRGRIVERGPRAPVFLDSRHPYTVALMTAAPHVVGTSAGHHQRLVLRGDTDLSGDDICRFASRCPMAAERCRTERPVDALVGVEHSAACWRVGDVPAELAEYRTSWHGLQITPEEEELV